MTYPTATLTDCLALLDKADRDLPVVFHTGDAAITGGYHVTELRLSRIDGIDCGGRTTNWQEAQLELLDGSGGDHMTAGKLAGILRHSLDRLPGLADAPLSIAFAPGNVGLHRYSVSGYKRRDTTIEVALTPARAICKPWQQGHADQSKGCCAA